MSKLKEYRKLKGVKQQAVASHLGVSRQTYSKYEIDPDVMTISQAKAVCDFLGCGWGDIFLPQKVN